VNPSSIVDWLEGLPGGWAYLAVLVVAFAEHALFVGTFVPGEVILPLTGVAAATTGVVAWPAAAACATAGGFLADQLTYWLGRWLARRRGDRPASPGSGRFARPAVVGELYRRHGALALALAFWRLRAIGADLAGAAAAQGDVRDA
jgi:membrane-associated protein